MNLALAPANPEKSNALDRVIGHLGDSPLDPDDCWVWQGTILKRGYGRIMRFGKQLHAHRMVWELLVGPLPKDLVLDHLCRNRACVNPDHLEPVPNEVNVMRGEGVCARNARKTHCPQGHAYDETNTYVHKNGRGRSCRACARTRTRERRQSARQNQEKNR